MIIKDACHLTNNDKYFKFVYNNGSKQYEVRWEFSPSYEKSFARVSNCLYFKKRNPPCETNILPVTYTTSRVFWDGQSDEQRQLGLQRLKPATFYELPTRRVDSGCCDYFCKYSYWGFDDGSGCVFIERNTNEDDEGYEFLFSRGYICLNGRTFPIFIETLGEGEVFIKTPNTTNQPSSKQDIGETLPQKITGVYLEYGIVRYLEKERGMKVKIDHHSNGSHFKYLHEQQQKWMYEAFTPQEKTFVIPNFYSYYDESDRDY